MPNNTGRSNKKRVYIDNMNFVREFLRSILLYGCYDMDDYETLAGIFHFVFSKKEGNMSGSKLRMELQRLSTFLPEGYITARQDGQYSCSYDFSQGKNHSILKNYLLGSCSSMYTKEYVCMLSYLNTYDKKTASSIKTDLSDFLGNSENGASVNTVSKMLEQLSQDGFTVSQKIGKRTVYSISDDALKNFTDAELGKLCQYLNLASDCFALHAPFYFAMRRIRLYMMDRHKMKDVNENTEDNHRISELYYRNLYTFNQLDDDQIYKLLYGIHNHRAVTIEVYIKKRMHESESHIALEKVIPVKIVNDCWTGRVMLICFDIQNKKPAQYRIDYINEIKIDDHVDDETWQKAENSCKIMDFAWSTYESYDGQLVHVRILFSYDDAHNYIRGRLEREKRNGIITDINKNSCTYEADVTRAEDMIPWIRSYGEFARVQDPDFISKRIEEDWNNLNGILKGQRMLNNQPQLRDHIRSSKSGQSENKRKKGKDLTILPPYENIRNEILTVLVNYTLYHPDDSNEPCISQKDINKIISKSNFYQGGLDLDEYFDNHSRSEKNLGAIFSRNQEKKIKCYDLNLDAPIPIRLSTLEKEAIANALNMEQAHYFLNDQLIEKFQTAFKDVSVSWSLEDVKQKNLWMKEIWNDQYSANLQELIDAIKEGKAVSFYYDALHSDLYTGSDREKGYPVRIEYAPNQDRMRVIIYDDVSKKFNCMVIGQMKNIHKIQDSKTKNMDYLYEDFLHEHERVLTMEIQSSGYAIERIVRLFSYYPKTITYDHKKTLYTMKLYYCDFDEKALIRDILSCGDYVHVKGNRVLLNQVRERVDKALNAYSQ